MIFDLRQWLHAFSDCVDDWRPDEDSVKRIRPKLIDPQVGLEAVQLPAEGIAARRDIHQGQRRLPCRTPFGDPPCKQDHARAGTPDRHLLARPILNRFDQPIGDQQFADRRTFTTRNNQAVDMVEMLRQPDLRDLLSKLPEHALMLDKRPLQGEDTDVHTMLLNLSLPAAARQKLAFRDLADLNPDHRLAKPLADLGNDLRILVMRRGFDDGLSPALRIARLEDPGPDKNTLDAKLHQ